MFSAMMVLISGNILSGLLLFGILLLFGVSYIILTRNGSRYPTNLCVLSCILCAIATDVIWSLFNFGSAPVLSVYGSPGPLMKLFYEFIIAGVIFFSGLTITNIVKFKSFRKTKIVLYSCFSVLAVALAFNLLVIRSVDFKVIFPGLDLLQTNIVLICCLCVLVIAVGVIMIAGRKEKSKVNIATAVVLAVLSVAAAAIGIYKCINDSASPAYTQAAASVVKYCLPF